MGWGKIDERMLFKPSLMKTKFLYLVFLFLLHSFSSSLNYSFSPLTDISDLERKQDISNSMNIKLIGQVGGPTQAVAVEGDFAYVGVGVRMVVLDISNPSKAKLMGETAVFDSLVTGVAVNGTTACVTAGDAGLYIIDISDPTEPSVIGFYDSPGFSENVYIEGNYAYIADGSEGLTVVDISNLDSPREVGSLTTLGYAFDVTVANHMAYVAAAGAGLKVIDVHYPTGPIEVGEFDTPGYAFGIALSNEIIYIADGWEGISIIDVRNPEIPIKVGSYKTPGWAFDVYVSGYTAYVADSLKGMRILDVSSLSNPKEIGVYEVPEGHFRNITVKEGVAYVADRNWGMRALSLFDPSHPTQVGFYNPIADARAIALGGNYAYIAAGCNGLRIIKISDPILPIEVAAFDTKSHAYRVAVEGNYAYVGAGPQLLSESGLHVIDVSDPIRPTRVGFYHIDPSKPETGGALRGLAVTRGIAYIANEWGLLLVDVSNPVHPSWLGSCKLSWPEATIAVAVSGRYAYMVVEGKGLKIVDVSNPSKPALIGAYNSPGGAEAVAVDSNKVYLAAGWAGLRVIDVSNPNYPLEVENYNTLGSAVGVAVTGDRVYVADGNAGLQVVGLSSSFISGQVENFDTPGCASWVAAAGDLAYVADSDGGMLIFQYNTQLSEKSKILAAQHDVSISQSDKLIPSREIMPFFNPKLIHPSISQVDGPLPSFIRVGTESGMILTANNRGLPSMPLNPVQASVVRLSQNSLHPSTYARRIAEVVLNEEMLPPNSRWIVTSGADSGPGTLRWVLDNARSGDVISFDPVIFPPESPSAINLISALPALTQGNLTIDASTTGVILNGSSLPEGENGLVITSNGNVIKGLQILFFPGNGVIIKNGAKNNIIGGNRTVGTGPLGEGNLISGNRGNGIIIEDIGTQGNRVIGNFIGTTASGIAPLSNGRDAVIIRNGASNNQIGGMVPAQKNIIFCRGWVIEIYGVGTTRNIVIGNYIGVDNSGMSLLGSHGFGVHIWGGASDNRIGGLNPGERNILSGGTDIEVCVSKAGSTGNVIIGNYIGTNAAGTGVLGVNGFGVSIEQGASGNIVKGNVISGATRGGVALLDWGGFNEVIGNLIGTDASGISALGNGADGITVAVGSGFNRIGGTAPSERNIIGCNQFGISLQTGMFNLIMGNFIGVSSTGTKALGNRGSGIFVGGTARRTFIGGTTKEEQNILGSNKEGVGVYYSSDCNFIAGNYIGIDASGTTSLWNDNSGINININSENNFIQGNLISGKTGIQLRGEKNIAKGNTITQSIRGLDASGNYNFIYCNKFLYNQTQASDSGNNNWYKGGIGNYWSDYTGSDANGDGIGDTHYSIPPNSIDYFPIMSHSNGLTIEVSPPGSGSVIITPNKLDYKDGENIRLAANPATDCKFSHWTGGCPLGHERDNPLTVKMISDKKIIAKFIKPIYAPLNFSGQKVLNRSLSQAEYINILTWQANPNNENIVKYRIFQIEGENQSLLVELSSSVFEYWHRRVLKSKQYKYALVAVNDEGREGNPAYLTVI